MDELPFEIYEAIFEHLHLKEITRLRAVCKKLRIAVKAYRIEKLHIDAYSSKESQSGQNGFIFRPRNLKDILPGVVIKYTRPGTSGPLPEQCFVHSECKKYYTFSVTKIFLKSELFNVQFLKSLTCRFSANHATAEDINKLTKLERLEIFFIGWYKEETINLCLPNVEVLILNCDWQKTIEIEAPRCKGFYFGGTKGTLYKFNNPNSVQYLALKAYDERAHVFQNVEHLQLFSQNSFIGQTFYSAFPLLKTLRIFYCKSLKTLKQVVEFKNQVETRDVKLFFHGIPLLTGRELDGYKDNCFEYLFGQLYRNKTRFPVLIDHYDQLEEGLNFVTEAEFSEVGELFEWNPRKFLAIFDNIRNFSSHDKIDKPELFFDLLASYEELEYLMIIDSGLDQEWFDRLASFKALANLTVKETKKIDFSFTTKLPKFNTLKTNHDVRLIEEIRLDELDKRTSQFWVTLKTGGLYVNINKLITGYYFSKFENFCLEQDELSESCRLLISGENFDRFESLVKWVDLVRRGGFAKKRKCSLL